MKHQILTAAILAVLLLLTVACKDEVTPPPTITTEGQSRAPTSSETTDAITTSPGTTAPETEPVTHAPGTTTPVETDPPVTQPPETSAPVIEPKFDPSKPYETVSFSKTTAVYAECNPDGAGFAPKDTYTMSVRSSTSIWDSLLYRFDYFHIDKSALGLPTLYDISQSYTDDWFQNRLLLEVAISHDYAKTGAGGRFEVIESYEEAVPPPPSLLGLYLQDGKLFFDIGGQTCPDIDWDSLPMFYYFLFAEIDPEDEEKIAGFNSLDCYPIEDMETLKVLRGEVPPATQPPETTVPEDTTPPYTEPKFDPAAPYRLITPTDVTTVYAKDRDSGSAFRGQIAMHLSRNDVFDRDFTLFDMDSTLLGLPTLNDMKQRYPDPEEEILILFYVTTNDPEALTHATLFEDYDGTVQPPPALRGIYLQNGNLFVDLEERYAPSHLGLEREPGCYVFFIDISDADRALLEELSPEQWHGIMKIEKS